jgi:hypothetical protein
MTKPEFMVQMFYPVVGDTAIAEILRHDDVVADLRLANIALDGDRKEPLGGRDRSNADSQ